MMGFDSLIERKFDIKVDWKIIKKLYDTLRLMEFERFYGKTVESFNGCF